MIQRALNDAELARWNPHAPDGMDPIPATAPEDVPAERQILGAIILDPTLLDRIGIEPRCFAEPTHRRLLSTMQAMHRDGKPLNPVLLMSELRSIQLGEQTAL